MKKIGKVLIWLVITNYGRYLLGMILAITGVFSQYGTIPFLSTNLAIFEYTAMAGIAILILQFIYHVTMAIVLNIKK